MRILLTANASYDPPKGGSTRSNLMWLRHLASRGHACRVVCAAAGATAGRSTRDGIEIVSTPGLARHTEILTQEIGSFAPDWVLVSSEDLSHTLLREAYHAAPERLVYLAHTPQWFPFGPASWHRDEQAAAMVRRAAAVVAIGGHMAGYIREHCGRETVVIHPPMYGTPPFPLYSRYDGGWLLMVNPCAVKGLPVLLRLAARFPNLPFAALEGWGTTSQDRKAMSRLPNLTVLRTVASIDEVLSEARLLLMPSLWYEGFGLIAMEAMLRGLPVIASDSGGLEEAKRGTGYVIPVRGIERYLPEFDETHMPVPVIEEQDVEPWVAAVHELTTSRSAYEAEARRSRDAAQAFVIGLRVEQMEELLLSLTPAAVTVPEKPKTPKLTLAQLALLAKRARERH